MSDLIKQYMQLSGKPGTKEARLVLLGKMTNADLDYLISQAGNQSARIFYAQFRK